MSKAMFHSKTLFIRGLTAQKVKMMVHLWRNDLLCEKQHAVRRVNLHPTCCPVAAAAAKWGGHWSLSGESTDWCSLHGRHLSSFGLAAVALLIAVGRLRKAPSLDPGAACRPLDQTARTHLHSSESERLILLGGDKCGARTLRPRRD